jgi:hypothetical protein
MQITLNNEELAILFQQDPSTKGDGGFQSFLVSLQRKIDHNTRTINLTDDDLEKIPRYAFDYTNGGWQTRLLGIFGHALGSRLGR